MAKRRLHLGIPRNPDREWNKPKPDAKVASAACTRILQKLEDADAEAWRRSFSFFKDIEAKITSMAETLEHGGQATEGQVRALANWEAAIDRSLGINQQEQP